MNDKTFFGRYANLSSFVVADETLHQISDRPADGSFMQASGLRFGLIPSGPLAQLERFEKERNPQSIFSYKQEFIRDAVQQEIRSREDIRDYANVTRALKFILHEVLPLTIDTARDLGELLHVDLADKRTGKEIIDDIINDELKLAKKQRGEYDSAEIMRAIQANISPMPGRIVRRQKSRSETASVFGMLTDAAPLYVCGNSTFVLAPSQRDADISFTIAGKRHVPEERLDTQEIERLYSAAILGQLQREAITEFESQIREDLSKRGTNHEALERFAKRNEFSYGNIGYRRKEDLFYVYWEMPKFVMQNPLMPEKYHPFPATKVAVSINASHGDIYHNEGAYILDTMVHPFLRNWDRPYELICILSDTRYGNKPEDVVSHLSTAINAFTNGLTMESLDAHGQRSMDAGYFHHRLGDSLTTSLTRDEAVAQGYRIRNEWDLRFRDQQKTGQAPEKGDAKRR